MSDNEQRDNNGALFKNEKKTSDKAPDYRGPCMVNGVALEVSGWIRKSKSGLTYMSLAFKPPYQQEAKPAKPEQQEDPEEDIHF